MSVSQQHKDQLSSVGWTVVEDVVSESDCDRHMDYLHQWLSKFTEWPTQWINAWIGRYKAGHLPPVWEVRLAAKPTFAHLWGTQRLLSSMDAIAIGRPPEDGKEVFLAPGQIKFRSDQTADQEGLHSYQGMLHLEDCTEDDWTYEVMEGSHRFYDEFMDKTDQWKCSKLEPEHMKWFYEHGCERKRLSCPKGGILLCDSRLFRADARPKKSRANKGRWRFMVHVCMTPASWATDEDIAVKRKAYEQMRMTTHWPSQKVTLFTNKEIKGPRDPYPEFTLPDIAKTDEAKKLVGLMPYDGNEKDCDYSPTWNEERWGEHIDEYRLSQMSISTAKFKTMSNEEAVGVNIH